VAAVLAADFLQSQAGFAFDLKPEAALQFFKQKGLETTFAWQDMLGEAHAHAFTVAKMMDLDLLAQTRDALDVAISEGQTFKAFADEITPKLKKAGWWGKSAIGMVDPLTGELAPNVTKGTPWRLQTIFRTNLQSAYAAGHWSRIREQKAIMPYLMYDAVDDHRTRPQHAAWDGKVLPVESPFWQTHFPPNGWNCRCSVIQLDKDQVEDLGLEVSDPPDDGTFEWVNPRTGKTYQIPVGIDPGFDYNPGVAVYGHLQEILAEKIGELPPDAAVVAAAAVAEQQATLAADKLISDTAKAALLEIDPDEVAKAEAALAAAAEEAQAKATLAKLAENAKGKTGGGKAKAIEGLDPGGWLSTAWKQVGTIAQEAMADGTYTATEILDQLKTIAAQLKDKAQLQTKLSQYKAAILKGKNPSPAQAAAFNSLGEDEQKAFLAKIAAEQEKAAKAAAAEALAQQQAAPAAGAPTVAGPSWANMTQIGPQKGSNPGGLFQDTTTGEKWYVKLPTSEDIARNEVLAGELYKLAGIEVPDLVLLEGATIDGRTGVAIASKFIEGVAKASDYARLGERAADGFATDAWLANWDVVGLSFDNLLEKAGRAIRVDVGGSLRYRAQGDLKGSLFDAEVRELDSLRRAKDNDKSAAVFGKLTEAQIVASAARVLAVTDDQIRAAVAKYGPRDAGEATRLIETLIARKAAIEKRYGAAVRAAAKPAVVEGAGARITAEEFARIEAARQNGYSLHTDLDSIEDQSVLIFHEADVDGKPLTSSFLKLRGAGAEALDQQTRGAGGAVFDANTIVADKSVEDRFITAIKGIATNATVRQTDVDRVVAAAKAYGEAELALREAARKGLAAPDAADKFLEHFGPWMDALREAVKGGVGAAQVWAPPMAINLPPFQLAAFIPAGDAKQAGIAWKFRKGGTVPQRQIDRGFARRKTEAVQIKDGGIITWRSDYYEAQIDGATVRYWRSSSDVPVALQGRVEIDVPGNDPAAAQKVLDTIDRLGVDSARPSLDDQELLYLRQIANHAHKQREFEAIMVKQADRAAMLAAAREWFVRHAGVNKIEDLGAAYDPFGKRQAFDQSYPHRYRPDIRGPEWERFERDYRLIHAITGQSLADAIRNIMNSGGQMASTTDKARRGILLSGLSPGKDIRTGGASYFFTRLRTKATAAQEVGVIWKSRLVLRLDTVSIDHDIYGEVAKFDRERLTGVDGWRAASKGPDNETIFKHSLSLFDDMEAIQTSNASEREEVLQVLRDQKIERWPDGRSIEEVVRVRGR